MTKERIIGDLEKRIERNQYLADYFARDNARGLNLLDFYRGKVEGLKVAKCLVELMEDERYWNSDIPKAEIREVAAVGER